MASEARASEVRRRLPMLVSGQEHSSTSSFVASTTAGCRLRRERATQAASWRVQREERARTELCRSVYERVYYVRRLYVAENVPRCLFVFSALTLPAALRSAQKQNG
jgi:hypothetical protein